MPKTCEPAAVVECPRTFVGCSEIIRSSAISNFAGSVHTEPDLLGLGTLLPEMKTRSNFSASATGVGSVRSEWGFSRCASREVIQGSYAMPSCR